jgi:hypothetical protein
VTAPILPWMSGAVIAVLSADTTFTDTCSGRVAGRTPSDVTTPYVTVRTLINPPINSSRGTWRPTVRVTAWCPPAFAGTDQDPFLVAWRIASTAAAVLAPLERHQQTYENAFYSPIVTQGPTEEVDTSRGPEAPMYGCSIEIEMTTIVE